MPVTRIKNNQITDATVNLGTRAVNFSLTAGKIANKVIIDEETNKRKTVWFIPVSDVKL